MRQWHALVIGVDRYPAFPGHQLSGCVNDANAMRRFLIERVQIPESNLRCLTSPRQPTPDRGRANAANIREEFAALPARVQQGDHLVLFYAGHGLRLSLELPDGGTQRYYGFAPEDVAPSARGYANTILGTEVHRLLTAIEARGAGATVIADTCHSGASTRAIADDPRERVLRVAPLSAEQSRELGAIHPALHNEGARAVGDAVGPFGAYPGGDYVMLTGCRDTESSKEDQSVVIGDDGAPTTVVHGLLTLALLKELEAVTPEAVRSLRWMDFFERLRRTVAGRAVDIKSPNQTPTLEGRREKTVFGGVWRPFAPGYTVRVADGVVTVDGGELHGLERGAVIEIHPPDTSDFNNASARGIEAVVEAATPMTSVVRPGEPAAAIADMSRARLLRPGPTAALMVVRVVDGADPMPRALRAALSHRPPGANSITIADDLAGAITPAHAELRRWKGPVPAAVWPSPDAFANERDGWVLVRTDRFGAPSIDTFANPAPDDIVAYLPEAGSEVMADALGQGLSAYARYLQKRDRRAADATLASLLRVTLRAGQGPEPVDPAAVAALPVVEPADGIYQLTDNHWIWAEIRALRSTASSLSVAWVMFSDDGNVLPLWPPEGSQPTLKEGSSVLVGYDRDSALSLTKRADQTTSMYTLALIAATGPEDGPPLNIVSLTQPSVQAEYADVIQRARGAQSRGDARRHTDVQGGPAWYAWRLRIAVSAARS